MKLASMVLGMLTGLPSKRNSKLLIRVSDGLLRFDETIQCAIQQSASGYSGTHGRRQRQGESVLIGPLCEADMTEVRQTKNGRNLSFAETRMSRSADTQVTPIRIRPTAMITNSGAIDCIKWSIILQKPLHHTAQTFILFNLPDPRNLHPDQLAPTAEENTVYDAHGNPITSMDALRVGPYGTGWAPIHYGTWYLRGGYMYLGKMLTPVHGITYLIGMHEEAMQLTVKMSGRSELAAKSESGDFDSIIRSGNAAAFAYR